MNTAVSGEPTGSRSLASTSTLARSPPAMSARLPAPSPERSGVTANVGVVRGGTRPNVVAEHCEIELDVRSPHEDTFEQAGEAVREIVESNTVPDVTVEMFSHGWHRPMEKKEGGARLADLAIQVAFELKDAATGGASDANTTSGAGVASLDGLGPIGGDDHGPNEWLDLSSVVPRISLLAGILSRLDTH